MQSFFKTIVCLAKAALFASLILPLATSAANRIPLVAASEAPASLPDPSPWLDVWGSDWWVGALANAKKTGIAQGYDDGNFRPTESITRQAAIAFIYRRVGQTPANGSTFSDVGPGHPFAGEIAWAQTAGVAQGYTDGTFRPTEPVTRQALAAWLWRAVGSPYAGSGEVLRQMFGPELVPDLHTSALFFEAQFFASGLEWLASDPYPLPGVRHGWEPHSLVPRWEAARAACCTIWPADLWP